MVEERLHKILRVLLGLFIVALLAVMAWMILNYRQDMQERSSHIAALSAEASAYEAELTRLRREQETEEMHIYKPEGPGTAVIAFLVDGEETLADAMHYGSSYGFTPTILLRADAENLDEIVESLSGSQLDVILYSRGIDSSGRIRRLQERLEEAGCRNTNAYLLRASDDTEANRKTLGSAGITTLFLYGDSLASDVNDAGTVELNYSYINKNTYSPANRLADLKGSEQGLLFAVDLVETTASDRQLSEILEVIRDEADAGHISIGSVAEAVNTVKGRVARETANLEDFLAKQEARSARIAELETIIREIYSHWDDEE